MPHPPQAEAQKSFIHGLDPRTKLVITAAFTVLVFMVDSLAVAAAQTLFFACLALLAGLPLKRIFPHRRFLAFLLAMVVAVQTLFRPETGGRYILNPLFPEWVPVLGGLGSLGVGGLLFGMTIACRVAALAVLMPLLVATTDAGLLALGLTKLGANYRAAHAITSTLNLVKSFEDEVALILAARRLRGADPRGLFRRLAEYRAIALPLMVKTMRRSVAVGLVMDSRAFGAHKTRTWLLEAKMSRADGAAFAFAAVYCAAVIAAGFLPGALGG